MSVRALQRHVRQGQAAAAVKNAIKRKPVTTYTDSCEAPSAFWADGAIPLRATFASDASGTRMATLQRTYEHPAETPPDRLALSDVNGMYCMGNDELVRYFPEGVGGKVSQLFPPGHPRGFLYRSSSHLLNSFISKIPTYQNRLAALRSLAGDRSGFVVDGETGTGKSALTVQAVHYARSRGIMTIYVPNAKDWTHGEWAWPSTLLPGFWDAPDASRQFLQYFARAHKPVLEKWALTKATPVGDLPVDAKEKQPKTLYDLCKWAFDTPAPASIDRQSVAIKFLMDELMAEKKIPMLFVVDGINLFQMDTHFRFPHPHFLKSMSSLTSPPTDVDLYPQELPRIPASRFTFVRALNKMMLDPAMNENKFFITSTTRDFSRFNGITSGFEDAEHDKNKPRLDEYAPFDAERDTVLHPLQVGNFNEYEYRSFFRFIVNSGELAGFGWGPMWHYSVDFETKLNKIDVMSNRNPQRVIDMYHEEITWKTDYQRIRQKQYLTQKREAALAAKERMAEAGL